MDQQTDVVNKIWRPIAGFENAYVISDHGDIFSIRSNRLLSPIRQKSGYLRVNLSVNGVRSEYPVHRLVALTFISNPQSKPTVNHINEIKADNRVENLEWATNAEQNIHGTRRVRASANTDWAARSAKMDYTAIALKHNYNEINKAQMKPVLQFTEDGFFIARHEGLSAAARNVKASPGQLCECLKGRRKSCGGFKWKYA